MGSDIVTNNGKAYVLAQEILAGKVLIQTEDMRRMVIDAAEVLTVLKRGSGGSSSKKKSSPSAPKQAETSEENSSSAEDGSAGAG